MKERYGALRAARVHLAESAGQLQLEQAAAANGNGGHRAGKAKAAAPPARAPADALAARLAPGGRICCPKTHFCLT